MPDTIRTFAELCAFFETGDKPTEQQFRDTLYTIFGGDVVPPAAKIYHALTSQNAPVSTTNTPSMIAGQIWTLDAYNAADAATIASLELVSGVLNAIGSKYRSATDQVLALNVATTLSYDGAPYIVSTNEDDEFSPFINTLSGSPTFAYISPGIFKVSKTGEFIKGKTIVRNGVNKYNTYSSTDTVFGPPDDIYIYSSNSSGTPANDVMQYNELLIIVNP